MTSPLLDPQVSKVLARLHREARGDVWRIVKKVPGLARAYLAGRSNSNMMSGGKMRDMYFPISAEQGALLYLTARAIGARNIVEFGTSFGISTLYLAAAVRDNGGGMVIGTELEASKQEQATRNIEEAGLGDCAEVRLGDALETLREIPEPVDMMLLDGWKDLYLPLLKLVQPKLRPGAMVFADNILQFKKTLRPYVRYVQSPENGFRSVTLTMRDAFEVSYYEGPRNAPA